jgi:hypothetical protein
MTRPRSHLALLRSAAAVSALLCCPSGGFSQEKPRDLAPHKVIMMVETSSREIISSTRIKAQITEKGAHAVVSQLTAGNGASWRGVIAHIETGQPDWLAVARALHPGADAANGEDLTSSVAKALRNNPAAVLNFIGADFPIESVCAVPLIEPTYAQFARWKRESLAALARIKEASLSEKARQCRGELEATKPFR